MGTLKKLTLAVTTSTALWLSGCASTTQTGTTGVERKQLLLVSGQQIQQLSDQQHLQTLKQARKDKVLDTDKRMLRRLNRISKRIIAQVDVFRPEAKNWDWEVHTIKSDKLNAYVSPSGKIMFYTGIIKKLKLTDSEIAAIMGHEVSHALREHARERISRQMAGQMGIGILAQAAGLNASQVNMAKMVSQLGVGLPHSRTQESEADVLGLELAARAGYDPRAAITLWQKMKKESKGEPPAFLSTHPSNSNRIAHLESLMPKVLPLYKKR